MGTKNVVESRDFRPFRMAALNGLLELPRISLVGYFKSVGLENRAALGAMITRGMAPVKEGDGEPGNGSTIVVNLCGIPAGHHKCPDGLFRPTAEAEALWKAERARTRLEPPSPRLLELTAVKPAASAAAELPGDAIAEPPGAAPTEMPAALAKAQAPIPPPPAPVPQQWVIGPGSVKRPWPPVPAPPESEGPDPGVHWSKPRKREKGPFDL